MANIQQITPVIHVPDFTAAMDFLTRVLGFRVVFQMSSYAYLEWEGAALRLLEAHHGVGASHQEARMTVYLDVADVDAMYGSLRERLATLPVGDVKGPVDQPWGQRELWVRMPDGHWMAFGQAIP